MIEFIVIFSLTWNIWFTGLLDLCERNCFVSSIFRRDLSFWMPWCCTLNHASANIYINVVPDHRIVLMLIQTGRVFVLRRLFKTLYKGRFYSNVVPDQLESIWVSFYFLSRLWVQSFVWAVVNLYLFAEYKDASILHFLRQFSSYTVIFLLVFYFFLSLSLQFRCSFGSTPLQPEVELGIAVCVTAVLFVSQYIQEICDGLARLFCAICFWVDPLAFADACHGREPDIAAGSMKKLWLHKYGRSSSGLNRNIRTNRSWWVRCHWRYGIWEAP